MKTIRQRLTQRLLLGWAGLLIVGGGATYFTTRAALTRQFDDALHAKAMALTTLTEHDNGRIELEFSEPFMREFEADTGAAFFQIWEADDRVLARSKSLGTATLPQRHGTLESPEYWNLELPTGIAGRAVGLKFQPQASGDLRTQPASPQAIVVVAADRRQLDQTLATLRLVLAGCGAFLLLLTAAAVPLLLRRELSPLHQLADQAERITAETLSARFPTMGLPAELAPISSRLNDLLQRLQTAFERERQFSDDLAHEFRTPIAELRSLADLALRWPDARSPDTDRHVLAVAVQMESMINRLLAIVRSEQRPGSVAAETVDLAGLIAAVAQPFEARVAARQLTLEVDVLASFELRSDPMLLRSIVSNLLDNAVEYSPPRSTIRIQTASQDGHFTLRVTNPVEHLAVEDVPRLFDRFWRKDAARSSGEHVGLGLSLARAFAASLGYTLSAALNGDGCLVLTLAGPASLESSSRTPATA